LDTSKLYNVLQTIVERPEPFEFYTASDLWTDDYTSEQMLKYHLNGDVDVSSRRTEVIEKSVAWIASHFGVGSGFRIADFGCGPGLYANRLARLGADVTGIDFSRRSIEYARGIASKDGLQVDYINKNYMEFETDTRFDLIIMIMCDYCALSPEQRGKLLSKFKTILKDNGAVLLDVYTLQAYKQREETVQFGENLFGGFWSPDPYYGFLNTFKYEADKVALDKWTIIEAERIRTVYNWLQYFSRQSLEEEFSESGFKIEQFYSDVAGSPYDEEGLEMGVVGRIT